MDKFLIKKDKREDRESTSIKADDEPHEENPGKKLKTVPKKDTKSEEKPDKEVKDSKTESTEVKDSKQEQTTTTTAEIDLSWIDKLPTASAALVKKMKDDHWKSMLKAEFQKPYFEKLAKFLEKEKADGKKIFPPEDEVFNAFNFTPFDKVKCVVIGQDPYHGPGQAHGLCFSVKRGVTTPPSLVNIYKELTTDISGFQTPKHGNLERWAKEEGLFLLNATLTVQAATPNSHKDSGWLTFTDAVMKILNKEKKGLVFILWGKFAQGVGKGIDKKKHGVIEAAHPSPLSASRFFGCKVFSKANKYLTDNSQEAINWSLPE